MWWRWVRNTDRTSGHASIASTAPFFINGNMRGSVTITVLRYRIQDVVAVDRATQS